MMGKWFSALVTVGFDNHEDFVIILICSGLFCSFENPGLFLYISPITYITWIC